MKFPDRLRQQIRLISSTLTHINNKDPNHYIYIVSSITDLAIECYIEGATGCIDSHTQALEDIIKQQ